MPARRAPSALTMTLRQEFGPGPGRMRLQAIVFEATWS
jgi:hypothetical protein